MQECEREEPRFLKFLLEWHDAREGPSSSAVGQQSGSSHIELCSRAVYEAGPQYRCVGPRRTSSLCCGFQRTVPGIPHTRTAGRRQVRRRRVCESESTGVVLAAKKSAPHPMLSGAYGSARKRASETRRLIAPQHIVSQTASESRGISCS